MLSASQRLTMTTLLRLLVAILSVVTLFVAVEAGSNEASKAWLAENAKKDGVHVLPSGLQYRVLRKVRSRAFAMFGFDAFMWCTCTLLYFLDNRVSVFWSAF